MKELREALAKSDAREQQLTDALNEKEEELKKLRKVNFISVTFYILKHKKVSWPIQYIYIYIIYIYMFIRMYSTIYR